MKARDLYKVPGSEGQENTTVFWIVTFSSLGDRYQSFGETLCPYNQKIMFFVPYCKVAKRTSAACLDMLHFRTAVLVCDWISGGGMVRPCHVTVYI